VFTKKTPTHVEPKKRLEYRQRQKKHNEVAHTFTKTLLNNVANKERNGPEVDEHVERALMDVVFSTTFEFETMTTAECEVRDETPEEMMIRSVCRR
jgi:hypothetical protein